MKDSFYLFFPSPTHLDHGVVVVVVVLLFPQGLLLLQSVAAPDLVASPLLLPVALLLPLLLVAPSVPGGRGAVDAGGRGRAADAAVFDPERLFS